VIIALGAAVWSLASLGSGAAQAFGFLVAMRIMVGVGEAAYGPAAPTILSDLFPLKKRGLVLAWFFVAIPFGSALGYVFGGMVASALNWRAPFHFAAIPGLILAALCLFFKDPRPVRGGEAPKTGLSDYLGILRIPSYRYNVAAQTAMTFAIGGMSFWAPAYFYNDRGQGNLANVNLIFGLITAVSGLFATILGGYLGERLMVKYPSAYFLVSGGGMFVAFPSTLIMLCAPFPLAWVFCFLAVFFIFLNIGPANTAIANVTKPEVRAMAFAVNIFIIHALGDAISPPLIGAIADRSSLGAGFVVVSLMMLLAGILWLLGAKHLPRDVERISGAEAAS
jgi:MFS transporter, Spinster family, sphingosine-1-phosphate transporter